MKSRLESLRIPKPCPEDWRRMSGDDRSRFCGVCAKDVTNLSACTREEAEAFLADNPRACVRVWVDAAGRTLHKPREWARLGARLAAAVSAGAMLQACTDASAVPLLMGKPGPRVEVVDGGTPEGGHRALMGDVMEAPADAGTVTPPPPPPPRPVMGAPPPPPRPSPPPKSKAPTK